MAYIKLGDFEKSLVEDISTLSGYSQTIVREVLEYTLIRQLDQMMNDKDISVPFLGNLSFTYLGDNFVAGARESDVLARFQPSSLAKRLVGDINDGDNSFLQQLLQKKIKLSLQQILEENT